VGGGGVLRIDAPPPPKPAAPAAPPAAAPAAPAPEPVKTAPPPKPLSRLEKLRLDARERAKAQPK
jgi:hypothetical protein